MSSLELIQESVSYWFFLCLLLTTSYFGNHGLWPKTNSPLWWDRCRAIGCWMGGEGRVGVLVEWGKKYRVRGADVPLGGAYAVYQQLSEDKRADFACIKDALYTAFALSPVKVYKHFTARRLRPGETVDVYLAELCKLATQFGGMTERGLVCAFIAGLLEYVENLLQATTWVDDLPISEILAHARAILKDSLTGTESAAATAQLPGRQEKRVTALRRSYVCQEPNHMARDCPRRRGSPRSPKSLICYRSKRQGHVAQNCPGNKREDESSAPVSPPDLIWMALCLQSVCRLMG